jgi:hypothetical protein
MTAQETGILKRRQFKELTVASACFAVARHLYHFL